MVYEIRIQYFSWIHFQEISGEENDKSAGHKFEGGRYSGRRVLVEEVRSKADQGIPLPTVNILVLPLSTLDVYLCTNKYEGQ